MARTADLKVFGQMNLDMLFSGFPRLPSAGEEVFADRFSIQLGGGPMVYPIVLSALGVGAHLGTFLGDGPAASICRNLMAARGFTAYDDFDVGIADPVVVTCVLSDTRDRRFVAYNRGARESLLPEEAVYAYLKDARVISAPIGHERVTAALHRRGTRVVFDVGWSDDLNIDALAPMLREVDIFAPNDKEAMKMTGCVTPDAALERIAGYTNGAIITLGEEGALYYDGGVRHLPALPGATCVDTTGAGDNFMAGVIYGLIRNLPLRECVIYGNIFAGISIGGLGCFGVPIGDETIEQKRKLYDTVSPNARSIFSS